MHKSVMDFLKRTITPDMVKGKRVLEVGSFNENGTPRMVIEPMGPALYIGVDMRPGPGVDVVWPAEKLDELFKIQCFDLVVCTEMLEHALDWHVCIACMLYVLRGGHKLIITARGPGKMRHGYPDDYWRFAPEMMQKVFDGFDAIVEPDPGEPGVLCLVRRPLIYELPKHITPEAAPCQA